MLSVYMESINLEQSTFNGRERNSNEEDMHEKKFLSPDISYVHTTS